MKLQQNKQKEMQMRNSQVFGPRVALTFLVLFAVLCLLTNAHGQSTNTATGTGALNSNTTGNTNTADGYQALFSNTEGVSNTASGYLSLFTNTTGGSNAAFGVQALFSNTTGGNNTA